MKPVLGFLLLLLAAIVKTELSSEHKQHMIDISNACLAETGATEEMVKMAMDGNFLEDPKFKEQLFCIGKNAGFIDQNGKHNKDEIKKNLMILLNDEARVNFIVEKCCEEKATPQETAFEATKCFFKEMHGM